MSSRQTFFLMAIALPAYKLAMLPSYMASMAGRDMWLTALCMLIIDVVVLSLIYIVKSRVGVLEYKNKVFRIITCGLAIAFCLYFILQAAVLSTETVEYMLQSFFDGNDRLQMIVPLIITATYFAYKGEKSLGRSADVFIWLLAITLGISIVFNSAELDFESILPVLDGDGAEKVLSGRFVFLWFGDYLPFLFIDIRDRESPRKGLVLIGALGIALCTSALFAIFTMQWGDMTETVPNAFARLAGYNFISADVGKADWIAILHWIGACTLKLSLLLLGASNAFKYVFGERARKVFVPVSGLVVILLLNFVVKDVQIEFELGTGLWIIGLIINVALPLIMLAFSLFSQKQSDRDLFGDLHTATEEVTDDDYMDEKGDNVCANS